MKFYLDWFNWALLRHMAVKLYTPGRLGSGRAAALAGMTHVEFLLALSGYEVFPFQEEVRELEERGL